MTGKKTTTKSRAKAPAAKTIATKRPPGRPTKYSTDLADMICERIACGESLKAILRTPGMPKEPTVFRWLANEQEFRKHYAHAREAQGDADADAVIDIADQVVKGKISHQAGRVAIEARKWSAGVRKPKVYGPRVDLNHGGQEGNPITTLLQQVSGHALPVVVDDPDQEP